MMTTRWPWLLMLLGPSLVRSAHAQGEYRNLDAGSPIRIEDATVTERYALDLDLANIRFDALSGGRKRFQLEPQVSYGILPYTEMWIRVPTYYREREITPRKGVAGIGIGGMYQWSFESLRLPAFAFAAEVFIPTGPAALPPAYSFKTLFTRSLPSGARVHLNAAIASYAIRVATPSDCQVLPGGTVCGGQGNPPLPPFDGPCAVGSQSEMIPLSTFCGAPAPASGVGIAQAAATRTVTHGHWTVGLAADKALPLRSLLFAADIFAERFEGIGRTTDVTAEVGVRKQVTSGVVLGGAFGRHFKGTNESSFLVLGATFSRALQGFWKRF
ncbi:MAG TPA: hypothetical protein VK481_01620 [Gemmatimonadaceae bacterium]|nr:hypothetical protein [Gemmatimonadaceae bacterium]